MSPTPRMNRFIAAAQAVVNHPLGQQIIMEMVRIWANHIVLRQQPADQVSVYDEAIKKLDELEQRYRSALAAIGEAKEKEESGAPPPANNEPESRTLAEPSKPEPVLAVACMPCSKGHLLAVSADLNEAVRFLADGQGVKHPEIQSRLDAAARELLALERHDWTPAKVAKLSEVERRAVERHLPRVRQLRQKILNQIKTEEDLKEAATEAEELWSSFREALESEVAEQNAG